MELLAAPIPWYRTRKFWGIVLVVQFLLNLVILDLFSTGENLFDFAQSLITALGAGAVWTLLAFLFNHFQNIHLVSSLVYLFIGAILIFMTFKERKVSLAYPLILFGCMLVTLVVGMLLLSTSS